MKIKVLITTYKRPDLVKRLTDQIAFTPEHFGGNIDVSLFEDKRGGKPNYQHLINEVFEEIKEQEEYDYYIQLPDDFEIKPDFFANAVEQFEAITDPRRICLNLFTDGSRIGKTNWTNFIPEIHYYGENRYYKTQWNDLCYIAKVDFFHALQFKINPIDPSRWKRNPKLSSGVGEQISKRLTNVGYSMYQVTESLCTHGTHESVMNPGQRKETPLTEESLDQIYVGIASIPSRLHCLRDAIASVLPYVDGITVVLNNYEDVPDFLKHPKIGVVLADNSKGDAEKFLAAELDEPHYCLTIDDDIIYPKDYIWALVNKLRKARKEGRKVAFGVHGKTMKERPISSYYKGAKRQFHCKEALDKDTVCDLLGTGTAAFHTDDLKIGVDDCKAKNMADVWFALACKAQGVEMVAVKRPKGWIKLNQKINHHKDTIYAVNHKNGELDKYIAGVYNDNN